MSAYTDVCVLLGTLYNDVREDGTISISYKLLEDFVRDYENLQYDFMGEDL